MTQRACRLVGLLLVLLLGMAQISGVAAPCLASQAGAGLPPPPDRALEAIPYLQPGTSGPASPGAAADTAQLPASKLAFQSLRDGNWEIYVADADGSNPRRVTNREASDTQPRFNRGCTRIVFANNASGNYEIATINPDGTDLRRLTMNAASDTQPAWSPDGTRIAFQSTRDGQSEIYVMLADGSNLTRLTAHDAYDGYPTWSPEGTRLAFSSNRSGSYAIWAMDADGSNPVQLSNQPNSVYPAWSPDGSRLAYSADEDGDGFLELWVMNADGSGQQMRHDPGSSMDAWVRSWSPDGRWVAFTRVHLINYQGAWYWDEAVMLAHDALWNSYTLELGIGGRDWHPDWQPLDALPPVVALDALPAYSRAWRVLLSWSARDEGVGSSGVTCFDLQAQTDGGTWADLLVRAPATAHYYTGVEGQQVKFRIRASDAVHNVGEWTPDAAASGTRLFSFYLSGRAQDVRGFSLPGTDITIQPAPVTQTPVDARGAFEARLARPEATQVLARAPGYASPPAPIGSVIHDTEAAICLPPLDDVVSNGGFEAGGGSLAGWQIGGTIPPRATTSARHTGQAAALLGPQAGPRLSPGEPMVGELGEYDLLASPDGTIHALGAGLVAGTSDWAVHYTYRPPGGSWATPLALGNDGYYSEGRTPVLAQSRDGSLHAAWVGEAGVYYQQTREDGTWTNHELIGPGGKAPALAADSYGGLHLVYAGHIEHSKFLFEAHRAPGGSWSEPAPLGQGGSLRLDAGRGGTVHLIWEQREKDYPHKAYYRQWTPEKQWSPVEPMGDCYPGGIDSLVEGPDGQVHAVWSYSDGTQYAVRSLDGAWSTPQSLEGVGSCVNLATDSTGMLYLVYHGYHEGMAGTFFMFKRPGQPWSEPESIFMDPGILPSAIAVDPADNPHVVYQTIEGDRYCSAQPAPEDASSTLSQSITIPSTQHRPTLSFFYELRGVLPGHEGGLRVVVDDGISSTAVLTATGSTGWTHAWAALDAWAGQTVTVTLAADSRAGEPYARLALDEVVVGSWMTPIPVEVIPGHVPAGVTAAITVSGQNFAPGAAIWLGGAPLAGTTWVADDTLTATVPAAQAAGRQPLWVVNPGGARGPAIWLRVGEVVFLPLVRR